MKKRLLFSSLLAFSPMLAFAATNNLTDVMHFLSTVVQWAVPFLIAVAILYFIWQVIKYTIASDEEKKKEAKSAIIWAVVGIFVIVSIWGLVGILQNTFAGTGTGPTAPLIPNQTL